MAPGLLSFPCTELGPGIDRDCYYSQMWFRFLAPRPKLIFPLYLVFQLVNLYF
jgi:hypothetical protein